MANVIMDSAACLCCERGATLNPLLQGLKPRQAGKVLAVERFRQAGQGTTSRNSQASGFGSVSGVVRVRAWGFGGSGAYGFGS